MDGSICHKQLQSLQIVSGINHIAVFLDCLPLSFDQFLAKPACLRVFRYLSEVLARESPSVCLVVQPLLHARVDQKRVETCLQVSPCTFAMQQAVLRLDRPRQIPSRMLMLTRDETY